MNFLKGLWIGIRPKTLIVAASPVLITCSYFYFLNKSYGKDQIIISLNILFAALIIQIISNLANDLFDFLKGADNKERVGPKRAVASGLISPKLMKQVLINLCGLAVIIGIPLVIIGGLNILIIGILGIILAFLYTASPIALAYTGLAEIFSFLFFGPIATYGTFYLLTNTFDYNIILIGIITGCFSVALLTANNLRDYESDKKSNRKNFVIILGKNKAKIFYYIIQTIPSLAILTLSFFTTIKLLSSLSYLLLFIIEKNSFKLSLLSLILITIFFFLALY